MAIDPYALTSIAAAKSHLGIMPADTSQDSVLERFINSSSMKIENYINRKILKREYTEYQDGRGNDRILFRQWPAEMPTELWDDDSLIDPSEYQLEDSSDGGIGLILTDGMRFSRGNQNIKVIYEAGYTTVPYDIEDACIFMVEFLYTAKQDRRVSVTSKSKNGESTQFRDDLPKYILDILDRYARVEFTLTSAPVGNGQ